MKMCGKLPLVDCLAALLSGSKLCAAAGLLAVFACLRRLCTFWFAAVSL